MELRLNEHSRVKVEVIHAVCYLTIHYDGCDPTVVQLDGQQAEWICNSLIRFIDSQDESKEVHKDACSEAVDMSRITPQEIRAHWQQQVQQGVEIIRALNHIEKGYKNGA